MEIFGEFFLTASLALFLSFIVAKVVAAALVVGDSDSNSKPVLAEDSGEGFIEALRCQGSAAERKVEFVDEVVETVDRLREEATEEVSVERSEIIDDLTSGGSAESTANDGVSTEPDEVRAPTGESEVRLRDEASEAGSGSSDGDEDNDWEGIERDEREIDFSAAVKFVEKRFTADEDLQAELYGLRKVAMEGTCREAMPEEALELSDLRVKWLAWQKLGDMPREVAMERYITLLSQNVPAWTEDHHSGERKSEFFEGETTMHSVAPAFSTNERESDDKSNVKGVDTSEVAVL